MLAHVLPFLVLGLSGLVAAHAETCLFHMFSVDASNNNLTVGQIPGGQLQGSKATDSATWFRIQNGRLLDHSLRGCWWAPVSTVLVCDVAFSDVEEPDQLFSITAHGDAQALSYNGTISFFACRSGRYDKVNYYLEQPDATCPQVFLHIDPDMYCFDEPFYTVTTTPTFSFSTPAASIPEGTSTGDLSSTLYDTTDVESTSTAYDTESPTNYVSTTILYTTLTEDVTLTLTMDDTSASTTASESYPPPSILPVTSTHPHYHSLSTLTPLSPPTPPFSTLVISPTIYPPITSYPSFSIIPPKSLTNIFSWTNSTTAPSTLKTKTLSPGVYGSGGSYSHKTSTPAIYSTGDVRTFTTSLSPSYEPAPVVATTLLIHTEREKGNSRGPVVETFTVTAEGGAVVTFAVEVER
ncbi:hypothetical protein QBC41DRAFT_277109 [Cercophora samala]|uniref:Uncharacterized protein n=1 Tax=Cercophora samala TaxID=330535 RepID=A0AA39ZCA7_9PEZI|nr:hypothetical protein QBC41DRAFT_277109 [Cercophora samala]